MRIALDAMGGDYAPQPNIDGAIAAVAKNADLRVALVGDEAQLNERLAASGYSGDQISVVAADGVVGMEEKPTHALRKKPNSSIAVCWQLMAGQEADAVVSAGNTGAVVAAGLRTRLFLKGVKRPGIAAALPTLKGRSILMDVGANPAARPEHLYQYAVMGAIYAREILGIESPKIGLLNIGSEDGKGNELYRLTHEHLLQSRLQDQYIGNVEGRGIFQGQADVTICEGFVGNVTLKASEGMAEFLIQSVGGALLEELDVEKDRAVAALRGVARRFQYTESGGAPLLGINGVCMICHGSSDARAIENALRAATTFENKQINSQISAELAAQPRLAAS